ncbi:MAG: hypothetical protein JO182_15815 [Acidobacteriaceae bacterium]|nr:hypothetical protein [Acidobacteriaceae bacterium]MBV9939632.1 hypothetical protein [Acidobacteriaceae bacterium]
MANLHSQTLLQKRFKTDRIRAAPILICTTLLAGFAPAQLGAQNLSTWMADQGSYIATVPMKGIAMPGTHDPATYQVPADGDYFKNQTVDFTGQLNNGTRWFDMRTVYLTPGCVPFILGTCLPVPEKPGGAEAFPLPGAFWNGQADFYLFGHNYNFSNITLANGLDQIRAFLDAHPKEIVILQLNGTISSSNGGDQFSSGSFMQVLDQHLRRTSDNASYIYDLKTACTLSGNDYYALSTYEGYCDGPPLAPQEVTPQQLYGTSARVILSNGVGVKTTYSAPSTFNLVWSDSNTEQLVGYTGNGGGSTNLELSRLENGTPDSGNQGLYEIRPNWQDYDKDSKILTLQAELTPFGDVTLSDPDPFTALLGPVYAANYFNPILASTIRGVWQPNSVNVVSVDNEACCNIAQSIIAHNALTFNRVPPNPNGASAFAIGKNGSVYKLGFSDPVNGVIDPDHRLYKLVGSGSTEGWAPVNVLAQGPNGETQSGIRLAVDPSGSVWVVKYSGQILKQDALGNFQPVNGPTASDIAVGDDGSVFIIGPGGTPYQYKGTTWTLIPGLTNATRIAAGPTGTTTVVDLSGGVYQYANGRWNNLNAPFIANSVGVDEDGRVWAMGADSSGISSVWRLTSIWGRYRENGVTLAVGHMGPQTDVIYVADQYGNAHRLGFPVGAKANGLTPGVTDESDPSNQ